MKAVIFTLALHLFAALTVAQAYEYGKTEDLKGLTTYWVDTGSDLKARETIVSTIKKELPDLELVEDLVDSEIRIQFTQRSEDSVAGAKQVYDSTIIERQSLLAGRGIVWLLPQGSDKTRIRLVLSFENSQQNISEKKPLTKFVREFIKAYKTANGMK